MITGKHFDELKGLIEQKKLRLLHVMALPRTNGTAFSIALTQAPEVQGQLNEPYFQTDLRGRRWDHVEIRPGVDRTFEEGCANVLAKYHKNSAASQGMITICIHEISRDLTADEYTKILPLISYELFLIRDPLKHALSLLTRYANMALGNLMGSEIKTAGVLSLLSADDALRAKTLPMFSGQFELSWSNMEHFITMIQESSDAPAWDVVDGGLLTGAPEPLLKHVSEPKAESYA